MAEMIIFDKVASVLLLHGEWYDVDPGTLTSIPAAGFLSGHPGTNALAWKSHGARLEEKTVSGTFNSRSGFVDDLEAALRGN
jgi:hypothetical protein